MEADGAYPCVIFMGKRERNGSMEYLNGQLNVMLWTLRLKALC